MIVHAIGAPKTGTHALVKALELLGVPRNDSVLGKDIEGIWCGHSHLTWDERPKVDKTVHIIRDPRNVVISWLRYTRGDITEGMVIAAIRGSYEDRGAYAAFGRYFGYQDDPGTLTVKFEDLISTAQKIRAIASYLKIPYIDGAFEAIPGLTKTWTGRYSDFTEYWTPGIEHAWQEQRGPELLERLGY